MKKKRRTWKHVAGKRPNQVTVYERKPGGNLYAAAWDSSLRGGRGGRRRISLRHKDRQAAMVYAAEMHAKLIRGETTAGHITLGQLLSLYDQHEVARKRPSEQVTNRRQAECFIRVFGADKDPLKLTRADWNRLTEERRSGRICAHGAYGPHERSKGNRPCPGPSGKVVRDRTVEADLRHLLAVLNWGCSWQDRQGRYLLRENPARGYPVPRERNPRRPIMTEDRYQELLAVAGAVMFDGSCRGRRGEVPSYLPELLILANETGRRLSAILGLTYEDLDLKRRPTAPNGAITWRADLDKRGLEWQAIPITVPARTVLDRMLRDRPGIGTAPLFPSSRDPSKPIDRHLADRWLREAEELAGLEPQEGGLWHPFRRKAATELKGAPDKDVMALLGWSDLRSLKTAYQHADPNTMLTALESRQELREIR